MHDFQYKGNQLYCEDVSIGGLAKDVGTPFYLYSYNTIKNHFRVFNSAFSNIPHLICFAVKANSNIALLRIFVEEGGGFDIVSGGELYRALLAGADPQKIVYTGVGKTEEEIVYALKSNILMLNVESTQELFSIDRAAEETGIKAKVALRVNPDIDAKTHPYISTGLKTHKFGISMTDALEGYRLAQSLKNIEVVGIHKHIGSQITHIRPFVDALERIVAMIDILKSEGLNIRYLDIGGGLGITYKDESPPHPKELAEEIVPILKGTGCTIIFEPGRVIVGNAGILVTKVLYTKQSEGKNFMIVDAAMNDLVRPSLYGSYHSILPVSKNSDDHKIVTDVVGPICESGDFLAKDRVLPDFKKDSLAAVMSAGAYGFTMSSNYNSRPRVSEILVKGNKYFMIRRRENYEDLVRGEEIPVFMK
ncbi:MAG: diaminopimelate decarboxylase [Nitrospinae bacterium]|nr:diaminopimelate decarboxylase [Nitrospinota bacterium]